MGKRTGERQRQYRKGAHHAAEAVLAGLRAGAEGGDLVVWADAVRKWREAELGKPPHPPMPPVLPEAAGPETRTGTAPAEGCPGSTSREGFSEAPETYHAIPHATP